MVCSNESGITLYRHAHASSKRSGRNRSRTRSGCLTCRTKKVKCDEELPHCQRCVRLRLHCVYSTTRGISPQKSSTQHMDIHHHRVEAAVRFPLELSRPKEPALGSDPPLSHLRPPILPGSTSACSLDLTDHDRGAINYFRTDFAVRFHTKNPQFSLVAVMFIVAQKNAMVMHMVLCIGHCGVAWNQATSSSGESIISPYTATQAYMSAIQHYSSALRAIVAVLDKDNLENTDLDALMTTLLLMVKFEQLYGDRHCQGLSYHLSGTAKFLKHRLGPAVRQHIISKGQGVPPTVFTRPPTSHGAPNLSQFAARMLVHLAGLDAHAAGMGVDSSVMGIVYEMLGVKENLAGLLVRMNAFSWLEEYSNSLYKDVWGDSYPEREIVDDAENRQIYALLGASLHLRLMCSRLTTTINTSSLGSAVELSLGIQRGIEFILRRFDSIFHVSHTLTLDPHKSCRVIANISWILPHFYALQLVFWTIVQESSGNTGYYEEQDEPLRMIMSLARQAYHHEGSSAMRRIAHPLLMVLLSTDDVLDRGWVVQRFRDLRGCEYNLHRARSFAIHAGTNMDKSQIKACKRRYIGLDCQETPFVV